MKKSTAGASSEEERNRDNDDIIDIIRRKLRDSRTKVSTVIQRCEEKDKNRDGLIHIDDLEDVLNDCIPSDNRITRRELIKFTNLVINDNNNNRQNNGSVEYEIIFDLLEPHRKKEIRIAEKWVDDTVEKEDIRWATQPGSVGEWLKKSACPAEIKNFKLFVSCLEKFERDSGMKISLKEDGGFLVPLGPDMRANISFFLP